MRLPVFFLISYCALIGILQHQDEDTISVHLFGEGEEELKREAAQHGDILPLQSLRKQYPMTIDNVRSLFRPTTTTLFLVASCFTIVFQPHLFGNN